MKKLLLFTSLFLLLGCAYEPYEEASDQVQTVEGKWLYEADSIMSANGVSNLMFEFKDGARYTYYYRGNDTPNLAYYETLSRSNSEGVEEYKFEDGVLTIFHDKFNQVLPLVIECDGGRLNFTEGHDSWVRLQNPECN